MERKHCSSSEKIKIIELNAKGLSVDDISDEVGRDQRTVRRWLGRWEMENTIDTRYRSGRSRVLNHLNQARLIAFLLRNPTSTLREIKVNLGLVCSTRTIDDYLKYNKIHTFDSPRKPAHFPVHLKARFEFARLMKNWNFWNQVILSNESGFSNYRSCARRVWQRRGTKAPVHQIFFRCWIPVS